MNKLQPNTTQIPNYFIRELMPKLSDTGFRVLMVIADQTLGWIEDPQTGRRKTRDWISYSQLKEKTGRAYAAISNAIKELEVLQVIEVSDEKGQHISKENRLGKKLFYRIKTSSESEEVSSNLFGKRNSESEDTKETYTKTTTNVVGGIVKKQPACPLLNGSALKAKYPNGHQECVEYLLSCEEIRGLQFTNRAKQFQFLHKLLKAGVGFGQIDKVIAKIDKKFGKNQWDFASITNWVDKGALENG